MHVARPDCEATSLGQVSARALVVPEAQMTEVIDAQEEREQNDERERQAGLRAFLHWGVPVVERSGV